MNFKRCLAWVGMFWALVAGAQTSTFTYQGRLASGGSAVTGLYDLQFALYDGSTNLIRGPLTNAPVGVTNGLFVTTLDFGIVAFDGNTRSLAIGVRPYGNTGAYNALTPNQLINPTPYAIDSFLASNALVLALPLAATNIAGAIPVANLSSNVALLNSNETFTGSVTASNFYGSGAALTGISATNLTGTLRDTTLSANVPLFSTPDNFSNNVTAVQFTGSGHGLTNVPGAFFWLTVNGTNAQASSNLGFIVTNNVAPVFINLPANASAGDTFRVAGAGQGGWILTQNAGQSVLAGNLPATAGQNWTLSVGAASWTSLASSADGTKLVGVIGGSSTGYIYTNTAGGTWGATSVPNGVQYWSSVASSADGTKLIATVGTSGSGGHAGLIYLSVNSGATWTASAATKQWLGCASSQDGSHLVAVSYDGYIYASPNGGATWYSLLESASWTGVACSADGTKIVACSTGSGGGYIWTGANTSAGPTITQQTGSSLQKWSSVASSANGNQLVATVNGGSIYVSGNGGVNWYSENLNSVAWTSVTSSGDGSHLAAVYTGPGYLLTSADSGGSWITRYGATNTSWTAITGSADGSKLAAASSLGIFVSGQSATTTGTNGYLMGSYQSALEIQYVGNGVFIPLSHEGIINAY